MLFEGGLYWKTVKRGVLNKCSLRHLILRIKKRGTQMSPSFFGNLLIQMHLFIKLIILIPLMICI